MFNYLGSMYTRQLTNRFCSLCSSVFWLYGPFPSHSFIWCCQWNIFECWDYALGILFFFFFNLYSLLTRIFHQHQGLSCNLNVDDTPTHISNQYVSHILLLHFQLLAGYLLESQPSISSAESFSSDSNWVLSPSLFQLFSQDPSFDDCT